jgi:predicted glutamine amidotransferase
MTKPLLRRESYRSAWDRLLRPSWVLGLSFNQPVRPSLSFRGFRHRSCGNPDGWGLAAFPDGSAQVFKEPLEAEESELATFLRDYRQLTSKIFVAHVRKLTEGRKTLADTHPSCREFRGRHFVFAHNGTLRSGDLRHGLGGRFNPVGETDSELAMCALLTWMAKEEIPFTSFSEIETRLRKMNELGNMNLLFSEGELLFAYHDDHGYKGLCFVRRQAPFSRVSLEGEDWEVDLGDEKKPGQRGYVIATKPLTDEKWTRFDRGCMLVFKDGDIIHPWQA